MPDKSSIKKKIKRHYFFLLAFVFFAAIMFMVSFLNHYFFKTFAWDYGAYNFAFYDYAHFSLNNSKIYLHEQMNFLQDHFSTTLMILLPFYWLLGNFTGTYTLLFLQSTVILFGGWAVYKLILLQTNRPFLSSLAFIHYFVIFGRLTAITSDCNITFFASSLLPVLLLFLQQRKWLWFGIVFFIVLTSREDMALCLLFIFLFLLIFRFKDRTIRLISAYGILISVSYFLFVFHIAIPAIETEHKQYSLFQYAALGNSPFSALMFILKNPIEAILLLFKNHSGNAAYDNIKREFYLVYFLSGGFLLLYRPQYLLLFVPLLAKKMFNDEPIRWSIMGMYSIEFASLLPFVAFAIIGEIKRADLQKNIGIGLLVLTLGTTLYKLPNSNRLIKDPINYKCNILSSEMYESKYNTETIYKHIRQIADTTKVCASNHIVPHLAWRKHISLFPKVEDAQIIVLLKKDKYPLNEFYTQRIKEYRSDSKWKTDFENEELLVLKRNDKQENKLKNSKIICSFETRTPDELFFQTNVDLMKLESGKGISNEKHKTGKHSYKMLSETAYALTLRHCNIQKNDSIFVSIWKYGKNNKIHLVAQAIKSEELYLSTQQTDSTNAEWNRLALSFVVPKKVLNSTLKFYLWNPEKDSAYFDDFELIVKRNAHWQVSGE
ncbi:MAG: hypothetical protein CSA05_00185 [Bacteroidia bacterium]|nr:MAG: hypothetical protein CSA05_00185 [Bacteroidia bacterium]